MNYQIFIPPIVGAAIGYITNDIAIKMLFRPRHPVYIGKFRIPLTPGLIPREKSRIAKSIGSVVSEQLLDKDTIRSVLTSENMINRMRAGIERIIDTNRSNNDTIEQALLKFAPKELVDATVSDLKNELSELIHRKITEYPFGATISKSVLLKLTEKINTGTFRLFSGFLDDSLVEHISQGIGEHIDKAIAENSEDIIRSLINKELDKIKYYKISYVLDKYSTKLPMLTDFIMNSYITVIENHLTHIVRSINVAKIIEDKIESFDVVQLEEMIFSIMKKELKAIVRLGAVLGFIMGWINLLIQI
ncbi:MAG: DUF445 family protein [Clostridia bacterium]|nr:DUF445 family protein [Clostridia bacterium]